MNQDNMSIKTPTEQHYHVKCKVVVKEVTFLDVQSKGESLLTEKLVHLVPVESTQRDLFLSAWLPAVEEAHVEIGMRAGYPIYGVFRGALKRWNKIVTEPHIFVMSRGAEEQFKELCRANGGFLPEIEIEILGSHEDELLDAARDYELPNKRKYDDPKTDLTSKDAY